MSDQPSQKCQTSVTDQAGRSWIILQGLGTDFQAQLTRKLQAAGDQVYRVYYCGGDWWFRGTDTGYHFTGQPKDLEAFYRKLLDDVVPDGIILFGDRRAIHKPIFELADCPIYVLEEGYLRPGYITFERGGTNAHSPLPKDRHNITELAKGIITPADPSPLPAPMRRRVYMDIKHILGTLLLRKRYPYFKTHRPYSKRQEAWGWAKRLSRRPWVKRWSELRWHAVKDSRYFFLPLQLNADTQMHVHSPFGSVLEVIEQVLTSFSEHAPLDTKLLIKNHPLDNGILPYGGFIKKLAGKLSIQDRVVYIDGGDATPMIDRTQGVVVVNSTVGLAALMAGKPTLTLGTALYDIDGLTDQQPLDAFWQAPRGPDAPLVADFVKLLKVASLVEGDLFTPQGIDLATNAIVAVLAGERPRLHRIHGKSELICHPPK